MLTGLPSTASSFSRATFLPGLPQRERKGDLYLKMVKIDANFEGGNNYQLHVVHRFEPVTSSRLKFEFLATNGSGSVYFYEVRVYNEN